jgi:hypothetical protein
MSTTLINNRQRAIITSCAQERPDIVTVEIVRSDSRYARSRYLNFRVSAIDAFIHLLQAERDVLLARDAGGA